MIKRLLLLILFCLSQSVSFSQGTMEHIQFFSSSLNTQKNLNIYLPPGYSNLNLIRYPVVYYLHGAQGNENTDAFIKDTLDAMIMSGRINPVILVKPDGSAPPYFGSFYTNSVLYGNFEQYIITDLIHFIDSAYKTYPVKDQRGLIGHSMGGFGTMKLAFKHTDLFSAAASHSGPLDFTKLSTLVSRIRNEAGSGPPYTFAPSNGSLTQLGFSMAGAFSPNLSLPFLVNFLLNTSGEIIDSEYNKWLTHSPARLAKSYNTSNNLALYFDCGTLDEVGLYVFNTAFRDTLNSLSIPNTFKSFFGFHSLMLPQRVPLSLAFVDSVFRSRPLPVELISFNAVVINNVVTLTWKTAVEINNYGFEIERKSSITDWEKLAFISGKGNSNSESEYVWSEKVIPGRYEYRLKQLDFNGEYKYVGTVHAGFESSFTYELYQNYPNPFNPSTKISYQIPVMGMVSLKVFDIVGREISTLVNEVKDAGSYEVFFDASGLSSGTYFYQLHTPTGQTVMKMTLLR